MSGPPLIYPEPNIWPEPEKKPVSGGNRHVSWSAMDVLAIVGLVVGALALASAIFGVTLAVIKFISPDTDLLETLRSPQANTILWVVQTAITLGVALAYLKLRKHQLSLKILGLRRTAIGPAALMLVAILLIVFVFQFFYFQVIESDQPEVTETFGSSSWGLILSVVIVAFLTPFTEEIFFRGIIHQGLERRFSFLPAALISSAVFAAFHLLPAILIPIFVIGFGFAYLTSKTDSIWPSIAGHFLFNLVSVLGQFFPPDV